MNKVVQHIIPPSHVFVIFKQQ